ncbi:Transcriptional regulator containing PAS, AAA-type ATPase, and DNA-binding Fis domains [Caloranaerobacter azorensis DSM 13643]|uniref:Transcriptional regulator containing PAS, AAA-type ATPase, and DNA-binding Fis domains n=1 Tax=Caloranaerobacter azorensis DSM 13643 TaxID=1121264 RepID=A0A1M5WCN4_9FIRM|nr:sigma 54-interacting transcriptional regulator [Caloranaerobacter azorensis]SHH85275.1 Transcriptional regulator containing PAS, AAA-type ATPase, and DNA-binding Fis domains [Caloranaerobacter azorensis DSM 13643]
MNKDIPELNKIYDTLVKVSNAIVSVINVDITIVDKNLNRITATGKYISSIGKKIDKSYLFAYALKYGKSFIIENPREHIACEGCQNKANCKEFAQVCCPINVDRNIVGIIGLIAFNEKQRNIILEKKKNLLDFLNRMADLIASKLKEDKKTEEITLMAKELEILVNSIDTGVIFTDENGNIVRYNLIADEIFQLDKNKIKNINTIVDNLSIKNLSSIEKSLQKNRTFNYKVNNSRFRGIYNAKPIIINKKIIGYIFTFNKMKEIIKVVNDVTGNNRITTFEDIIGESREISLVKNYAKKISKGTSTVLIQGESGTGKELFARAIHFSSDRKNYPFIPINCGAIPENLIESELFGYEEGAFTGAKKGGKIGKFELAHKGTIFLDEIGDMPIHLQTKLLRVLQENVICRIGGNTLVPIDVRIIAATNKNLEKKVEEGEFREDLYYRLNVIPIHLPPLRERLDDIKLLANKFLDRFNIKLNRNITKFSEDVIALFLNYNWPGNVRELQNVVEYAVNMSTDNIITIDDLPKRFKNMHSGIIVDSDNKITPISELEKQEIIKALKVYGNSKKGINQAAKALGISRATIYRKIKLYGLK